MLDWLACPICRHELSLSPGHAVADDVHDGDLICVGCARRYPIVRGIPRLLPDALEGTAAATAARFGDEWRRFDEIRPEYEAQFRGWIAPVAPDAFRARRVLDAGCGKGRHLRLAAAFGADDVIGVDLGPAIEVAAANTADLSNVHVVQGDLTRPPIRPGAVDLVYSIGVLHHLSKPADGFRGLAPLLGREGRFVAWLYAREGNGLVLAVLDPLRRATRRLPLPFVNVVAWLMTAPLWVAIRTLYGPARSRLWLRPVLPYQSYLSDAAPFPFREIHHIVFDQLMAPVAHYMSRGDVEACFNAANLTLDSLRWHHANSWAATGTPVRG